jgi:hypothetical protein
MERCKSSSRKGLGPFSTPHRCGRPKGHLGPHRCRLHDCAWPGGKRWANKVAKKEDKA